MKPIESARSIDRRLKDITAVLGLSSLVLLAACAGDSGGSPSAENSSSNSTPTTVSIPRNALGWPELSSNQAGCRVDTMTGELAIGQTLKLVAGDYSIWLTDPTPTQVTISKEGGGGDNGLQVFPSADLLPPSDINAVSLLTKGITTSIIEFLPSLNTPETLATWTWEGANDNSHGYITGKPNATGMIIDSNYQHC